jgi:hypothetical protein
VQVVQRRVDHVLLRVVPGPAPADRIAAGVARVVAAAFGPAMRHEMESVPAIEPEPSGKFRFAICAVPETDAPRVPLGVDAGPVTVTMERDAALTKDRP